MKNIEVKQGQDGYHYFVAGAEMFDQVLEIAQCPKQTVQ